MVSEIQESARVETAQVWVAEFGLLEARYLEPGKTYQGRLYRLSSEALKALSESIGFTVKFDSPMVRTAYLDVSKAEGFLTFEIERNTNPTELGLRYARDRWSASEPASKAATALRPWIKSNYTAKYLPDKVLAAVADLVKLKPEEREHFLIRINFKDRTAGLVAEDRYIEEFPAGPFQVFALPQDQLPVIPVVELAGEPAASGSGTGAASGSAASRAVAAAADSGAKYATYSQSEIDRMFKVQTDSISNALSGKISAQQRLFQDAVASQEKAFAKLADKLTADVEDSRTKLESHTKAAQEATRADLEHFRSQLSRELEQFRAHINKNVVPISKQIDEKLQAFQARAGTQRENLKPWLIAVAAVLLIAVAASAALVLTSMPKQTEISELHSLLSRLLEKGAK